MEIRDYQNAVTSQDCSLRSSCHYADMRNLFILAVLLILSSCNAVRQSDLPPLIFGATSRGGVSFDCRLNEPATSDRNLAASPEILERLRKSFPLGSSSAVLRSALVKQGFKLMGSCSPDGTISWAQFRKNGNEVVASIFWREDQNGKLAWYLGDIAYTWL